MIARIDNTEVLNERGLNVLQCKTLAMELLIDKGSVIEVEEDDSDVDLRWHF